MEAREDRVASVRDFGLGLVRSGHGSAAEIQKAVEQLDDAQRTLHTAWGDRKTLLGHAKDLQDFLVVLEQREAWISTKEASLALHNLGVGRTYYQSSVVEVEDLLRRHAQLEVQLDHLEHLDEVQTLGQQMIQQNHYDSSNISTKIKALATRTTRLVEQSQTHRTNLERSLQLHHFLSSSLEVCVWLKERRAVALDESWRDWTNLQSKLLKHQSFQADVLANQNRVDALIQEGEGLVSCSPEVNAKVSARLSEVRDGWTTLLSSGQEKNCRLQQAYQALQFQRSLDDIDEWAGSVERELTNEDCGSDLPSVNRLLKALQGLEEEVDQYRDRIQTLMETAKSLVSEGNHLAQEIQNRTTQSISRYNGLAEPLLCRRETLESWQLLFQFYRDEEEELTWMTDRLSANSSTDYGNTLSSTQQLMKKHQVLMQEISSRTPLVQAVQEAGQSLVRVRHFASHDIMERVGELQRASEDLRREGLRRSGLLQEALRIHHFLSEVLLPVTL
ncbi:Spectrin alpha chain, non-erythrocytic 1 [Merluccius polli]|uniref:Spectrin alpha chain, non-erythrocytic 1 n=1 Tax=Merluccius polli TaxID=89951 RepID=A0AA47MW20_MERPO|nr:Spectrin alpha chain, non-erythrocytic 1 [Merluccius polli]